MIPGVTDARLQLRVLTRADAAWQTWAAIVGERAYGGRLAVLGLTAAALSASAGAAQAATAPTDVGALPEQRMVLPGAMVGPTRAPADPFDPADTADVTAGSDMSVLTTTNPDVGSPDAPRLSAQGAVVQPPTEVAPEDLWLAPSTAEAGVQRGEEVQRAVLPGAMVPTYPSSGGADLSARTTANPDVGSPSAPVLADTPAPAELFPPTGQQPIPESASATAAPPVRLPETNLAAVPGLYVTPYGGDARVPGAAPAPVLEAEESYASWVENSRWEFEELLADDDSAVYDHDRDVLLYEPPIGELGWGAEPGAHLILNLVPELTLPQLAAVNHAARPPESTSFIPDRGAEVRQLNRARAAHPDRPAYRVGVRALGTLGASTLERLNLQGRVLGADLVDPALWYGNAPDWSTATQLPLARPVGGAFPEPPGEDASAGAWTAWGEAMRDRLIPDLGVDAVRQVVPVRGSVPAGAVEELAGMLTAPASGEGLSFEEYRALGPYREQVWAANDEQVRRWQQRYPGLRADLSGFSSSGGQELPEGTRRVVVIVPSSSDRIPYAVVPASDPDVRAALARMPEVRTWVEQAAVGRTAPQLEFRVAPRPPAG